MAAFTREINAEKNVSLLPNRISHIGRVSLGLAVRENCLRGDESLDKRNRRKGRKKKNERNEMCRIHQRYCSRTTSVAVIRLPALLSSENCALRYKYETDWIHLQCISRLAFFHWYFSGRSRKRAVSFHGNHLPLLFSGRSNNNQIAREGEYVSGRGGVDAVCPLEPSYELHSVCTMYGAEFTEHKHP